MQTWVTFSNATGEPRRRCGYAATTGTPNSAFLRLVKPRFGGTPLLDDKLSGMESFFASVPLQYLHHDDRINPRSIGSNIRGLIEEFVAKRPQLHVALGWWAPTDDGAGVLKVFDGQHKAAAQILLGVHELPIRVFVEPDTKVLLQANTNAGGEAPPSGV